MMPFYENWTSEFHSFEWQQPHRFLPHIHRQLELMYVAEGSIIASVDFQEQLLQAGDLAVILPHRIHGYALPSPLSPTNRIWGMVIAPSITGDFEPLMSGTMARQPFVLASMLETAAADAVRQIFQRHYQDNPLITKAYLQLLLAFIWPRLSIEQVDDRQSNDILTRVIQYVLEHYRQPLHMQQVAAEMGVSTSYLARLFSRQMHMGFTEYVNRLRVQAAQDLLRSTHRPITDILLEVGFESQSTFNRVFRDIQGVTPRAYRQQTQTGNI